MTPEPYRPPSAYITPLETSGSLTFCFTLLVLGLMLTAGLGVCSEYVGRFILSRADILERAEWNQARLDTIFVHYFLAFIGAAAAGSAGRLLAGPRWNFFVRFVGLGFVLVEMFFRGQLLARESIGHDIPDNLRLLMEVALAVPALVLVVASAVASARIAASLRDKQSSRERGA